MSEKRLKSIAALVGVALLTAVTLGALLGSRAAAGDLQTEAERALASAHLDGVTVTFHGREAELSGSDADQLGKARRIVEGIDGVRWADVVQTGNPTPEPPATTPTLNLRRTGNGITIEGTVPDADAAAGIKARVAEDFAVPVTGDLMINPVVGGAAWIAQLPDVFGDIVGVKDLGLAIDGTGTLELSGSIESRAGADDVLRLVAHAAPGLDVVDHVVVRPGTLSEADAAVLNSATLYFASGSSNLGVSGRRVLDSVAEVLNRNPGVEVQAGAHAGPHDPAAGEVVGLARVAAVKAYLVRAGVDPQRLSTRTFASDSRTVSASAQQFRRVDFVVTSA
ncbi:OmpA family protein [Aeromicrobium ginsengisoli]|uniref:OmpA family protein n=1 Tax=Aeromicrobium ginsengisoli TaxID=363867 RepID=A0A5M4FJK0_9ACTN|nr:OmpA family protein [Aeromicrobium ginsengisoli]KAA1400152.1 OmpA family protein [Aeromicrobium ginsengisoli]